MRSARALYRLNIAVGAAAGIALLVAAAVAVRLVRFDTSAISRTLDACQRFFGLPSAASAAVLGVAGVVIVVVARAVRSLLRRLRSGRNLRRRLAGTEPLELGGAQVRLVDDHRVQAFCAGYLQPSVFLSTGALESLGDAELHAVLAHERHHQARRDPLRLLILEVLADALFFLPALRRLRERYGTLAEVAADEAAVRASGADPGPLASALLRFGSAEQPEVVVGIAPERVDHLLGDEPHWALPRLLVLGAAAAIAVLVAVTVGMALVAPDVLSFSALIAQICMLGMVAAPALAGAWLLAGIGARLRGAR